jgi:hypothetical protein
VFQFDPPLFESMIEAWDRGDAAALARLWKAAEPMWGGHGEA